MKANAPEKIYLQENTTTDCYDELWPEWFEARAKDNDVEYTRTDAFIEKACEYLEPIIFSMNLGDRPDTDKFIEDFRKYMKGE